MESIFRLSVIVGMIDNMTSPMRNASAATTGALQRMTQGFGELTKFGVGMTAIGDKITSNILKPVEATFETQRALGELSSLGIKDLSSLENSAKQFSDQWAGTSKSDFLTAAYDIKSGIASLSDEAVGEYTSMAGLTAKATKSNTAEMTSLFATGYGIYKDYYKDLSDMEFGEVFSAGISKSVQQFKTSGSGMAQSIQTLGATATSAQVPLEEQLSVLGMLQATMSGSEAGTKYKAFLNAAVSAGDKLGLSFTDANNQMLSLPEILDKIRGKFGDTMDAAEKMKLKEAFGTDEAVALIDLMYNKTGDLQSNITTLYDEMGKGTGVATEMADAINSTPGEQYEVLKQRLHNVNEEIGVQLLPTINNMMQKGADALSFISNWISNNQELTGKIAIVVLYLGIFLTALGTVSTAVGALGLAFTKALSLGRGFVSGIKVIPDMLTTLRIRAMYAGDGLKTAFSTLKSAASTAVNAVKSVATSILSFAKTAVISGVNAVKSFVLGMASMAKQAIVTAAQAMPGLIASVWSFTGALLANPITWVVIAIVALIAALVLLWQNWNAVVAFIQGVFNGFVNGIISGFEWIKTQIASVPAGFQILLAVIMPIIGIPMLIINNWSSIVGFFTSLWTGVKETFVTGINNVKNFISGTITWFRTSGQKVITTFCEGIKSVISKPAEIVQEGLAKVRQLLPFSDAKKGPLSTLTLSGKRVFETINTGMKKTKGLPAQTTTEAFSKMNMNADVDNMNLNAEELKSSRSASINLKEFISGNSNKEENNTSNTNNAETEIHIHCDFSKLKSLDALIKFAKEIEEYVNGDKNNDEGDIEEFVFE